MDETFIVLELHLDSEVQCVAFCNTFATQGGECTFTAWTSGNTVSANCVLYKEPFRKFLSHCDLIGGPKHLSATGCNVANPEDHSCDVFR